MTAGPPAAKPSRMRMLLLGLTVVPWVILLAVAGRLIVGDAPLLGFAFLAIGSVTMALSVRRVRAAQSPSDPAGGMPTAEYDYIVWAMFAVPFLLVALLLVMLVAGQLRPT